MLYLNGIPIFMHSYLFLKDVKARIFFLLCLLGRALFFILGVALGQWAELALQDVINGM